MTSTLENEIKTVLYLKLPLVLLPALLELLLDRPDLPPRQLALPPGAVRPPPQGALRRRRRAGEGRRGPGRNCMREGFIGKQLV